MTDISYDILSQCIDSLTENEAIDIIIRIEQRFGFAGTTFTRVDAEQECRYQTDATGATPFPDEVWQNIQSTWLWRKGMSDILTGHGWELLYEAVAEAIREE